MNKNFRDPKKGVHIKILDQAFKADREVMGVGYFADRITVPAVIRVDSKTIVVETLEGTKSTKIDSSILCSEVAKEISERKKIQLTEKEFDVSIFAKIRELKSLFYARTKIFRFLCRLEQDLIDLPLYPVHGDLQKQNILFGSNLEMIYIDFEHFIFAPIELELANSLFFGDRNCLDVDQIVKKTMMDHSLIQKMLLFYAIKQYSDGRSLRDTKDKLKLSMSRLKKTKEIANATNLF